METQPWKGFKMAFLHCHHCNWNQDDFWGESYWPFPSIEELKDHLLAEDLDAVWLPKDGPFPSQTHRQYIVKSLLNAAKRVWKMKFRTFEEWDGQPCPQCKNPLCVD